MGRGRISDVGSKAGIIGDGFAKFKNHPRVENGRLLARTLAKQGPELQQFAHQFLIEALQAYRAASLLRSGSIARSSARKARSGEGAAFYFATRLTRMFSRIKSDAVLVRHLVGFERNQEVVAAAYNLSGAAIALIIAEGEFEGFRRLFRDGLRLGRAALATFLAASKLT